MNDIFGRGRRREVWTVQLTYPNAMIPQHAHTFCAWSRRVRGTQVESRRGADLKDDSNEVVIERFEFGDYDDAAEFCRYTCQQFEKWSGDGMGRRFTIKVTGQIKFTDKTEGNIGAARSQARQAT
ncbi:MAG TPA: hypothetical protein VFI31_30085 [Pirellulales bacterium]|nr:hypothetical protein [Pirellulales bacterium]